MLVPPTVSWTPLFALTTTLSATIATSGTFRWSIDPLFVVMSIPCCQLGIGQTALIPPPLPPAPAPMLSRFQAISDDQPLAGPRVKRKVPPTLVI